MYNKIVRFDQPFWDHRSKSNDYFWQKTTLPSPVAQRKLRKTNKANLHPSQNDENTVGFDAFAGGLKEWQVSTGTRRKLALARDLFYAVFDAIPIPTVLRRPQDEIFLCASYEKRDPSSCVMLSGHVSQDYARSSLAAGARGYLVKDQVDEILNGIECVLQGEIYVSEKAR